MKVVVAVVFLSGFGFVTFENAESVGNVLRQQVHLIDNKKVGEVVYMTL